MGGTSPLLELWIPGAVESANRLWRRHPMERHKRVKAVVVQVHAIAIAHALLKGIGRLTPPVAIHFCMVRKRLFDEGDDLAFALKAHRDGVMRALLPTSHDGPGSGNRFSYGQRLAGKSPEGVEITVSACNG